MPDVPESTDALPPDPQFPASVPADLRAAWGAARSDEERAMALLEVAYFLEDFSKWQAAEMGEQALQYAKRSENRTLIARILLSISFALGEGARFTEAFGYLSQTIALAHTMSEEGQQILLDALCVRGTLRHNLGDEHGAQRDFLSVLSREDEAPDPITLLLARVNLVGVYATIHQPEVALHHSRLAGEQLSAIVQAHAGRGEMMRHEDHYRLGVTETRVAAFLEFARQLRRLQRPEAMHGALDEAEGLLDMAVQLAGTDDNVQQHMLLEVHAAHLKLLRDDLSGAETHARRAAALTESLGASIFPEAYLALARVLSAQECGPEAAEAYRQALDIARKCGRHRVIQEVLGELSELHEQQGDLQGALRAMREALSHAREALQVIDQAEFVAPDVTVPGSAAGGFSLPGRNGCVWPSSRPSRTR
ncbi:tetratricopeptide repeat protein [Deinococcus malanensis]|uniref:tetratricopeptide repeat protein n=1 Tax=Deinococcus malanensis TaxID=1706855 RepID=UPI0036392F68